MKKGILSILILMVIFQFAFAQKKVIELNDTTFQQVLNALVYINYQAVETNRPKNALFYYNDNGEYLIKVLHSWRLNNAADIVLTEIKRFSSCRLKKEVSFDSLDVEWLKKQILSHSENFYANFIYFDEESNIGYFRTYELFTNENDQERP